MDRHIQPEYNQQQIFKHQILWHNVFTKSCSGYQNVSNDVSISDLHKYSMQVKFHYMLCVHAWSNFPGRPNSECPELCCD